MFDQEDRSLTSAELFAEILDIFQRRFSVLWCVETERALVWVDDIELFTLDQWI
jgi:hypothetical protein